MDIDKLKSNFENRNIDFEYCESRESLLDKLAVEVKNYESIGIGNSQTLKALAISELASQLNKTVYDKSLETNKDTIKRIKKLALTSECYISSSNAIGRDGTIVNIDHSGNRVAAMTYGPDRVLIVVGINKLSDNENKAIFRALNKATPDNAKRAGIESPCSINKPCSECHQSIRVCNYISVIRGQHEKGRMKVYLLNEDLGF